ncbi:MAG: hypothetical protein OXE95_04785 [Chloroflexi bacterium]|nr:hypothetical protein [Chloroflexota bacterium]MCY4246878.1 hypothetical protein [Chloroflexota bacterium]
MIVDGVLVLSVAQVIAPFKYFVYLPACLLCVWLLLPRLTPFARRVAAATLVAQVILLLMALDMPSVDSFWGMIWHFDKEHNIPSAFSSTMFAFGGAMAMLVAAIGRERPVWQRLYLIGSGLVLLTLGIDEYYEALKHFNMAVSVHEWERNYTLMGQVAAAATALVALASPRRDRFWHICTLAGLASIAFGGLALDSTGRLCGLEGFVRVTPCDKPFAVEEIFEHLGSWLALVAMLGHFGMLAATPSPRLRRFIWAIPLLWLLLIPLNAQVPRLELPNVANQTNVRFDGAIEVQGYTLATPPGEVSTSLYVSARQGDYAELFSYFVDLVDQVSGISNYKHKADIDHLHGLRLLGAQYKPVYRQPIHLRYRRSVPVNRAHWVVLAAADKRGLLAVQASDLQQLGDKQVILGELVAPAPAADPPATFLANYDAGFALVDIDLPDHAQPGDRLEAPITWHSAAESGHDYTQFLHFVHEETGAQWGYDQPPLGDRLPTRLWYAGMLDTEIWLVTVPDEAPAGEYAVYSGLYTLGDMQRLPAKDAADTPFADARVPLGSLRIGGAAE